MTHFCHQGNDRLKVIPTTLRIRQIDFKGVQFKILFE